MSTKTTFKRISLVTVAALGLGLFASVAPATAATTSAITTSVSVTGTTAGTTADPFATGSDIKLNVIVNPAAASETGDTFTVTYNVYNPKGETITGITLVETSTSVSLLGNGTDTGTVVASGNTLVFKDTVTAGAHTVATLTIPAAYVTTGGIYQVKATAISGSTGDTFTLAANQLTGTTSVARGELNVSGAQVTQGTVVTTNAGSAVTGGNARVKFFFPKVAANGDVYRITSSGVGTILSVQGTVTNGTASAVSGTTYAGGVNIAATSAATATDLTLNLTSDVAGEQKLTFWSQSTSTGALTAVFTGTVTWGAAPAYVASTAFIGATGAAVTADITAATRTSSAIYATAAKARIDVKQYTDAAKTIQTAGTAKSVLVSISGAGAVDSDINGATRGAQALVAGSATAATDSTFYVFADGRSGKATITVSVNGVEVKSWTWSFTGTVTSLKEDADNSPSKTYIGVGETGTLTVLGYDANSVLADSAPSVYATSDTATVATVSSTGTGSVTVTGVAAGKTNINICVGACASATVKVSIPVEITKVSAKSAGVTLSFDKTSYEPGEKMVLTVKAVDSNDRPVADGDRALFAAALTSNVSFGGASVALPTATVSLAAGEATYTLYAPSAAGTVTVSGKEGAAVALTERAAGTAAGVAYVAKAVTTSVTVVNSAIDGATDAANEAAQAASDATDAALAAADAADLATGKAQEALDAVNDLANTVATLIADLKSQIKTLSNLVTKIAKKVKA